MGVYFSTFLNVFQPVDRKCLTIRCALVKIPTPPSLGRAEKLAQADLAHGIDLRGLFIPRKKKKAEKGKGRLEEERQRERERELKSNTQGWKRQMYWVQGAWRVGCLFKWMDRGRAGRCMVGSH